MKNRENRKQKAILYSAITLFVMLAIASCKKDDSLYKDKKVTVTTTTVTTTPTTTAITAVVSYDITYKICNPYLNLWTPTGSGIPPSYAGTRTDSIIVSLDSANAHHNITLVVSSQNSGASSPSSGTAYNTYVNIHSGSSDVYITTNLTGLVNDSISNALGWVRNIQLAGSVYMAGCIGTWGCGFSNDRYVGIKITSPSGDKFGWIELYASSNTLTMKAEALNNNYGQAIKAGQTN